MVTLLMTSRDLERLDSWPQYALETVGFRDSVPNKLKLN